MKNSIFPCLIVYSNENTRDVEKAREDRKKPRHESPESGDHH